MKQSCHIYRPEIDGLRAFSVMAVMLFHAGLESFRGGYVGVDVFFVISGYLISKIILSEKEQGRFSLIDFYLRRIRRIIPMLFLVSLICIPIAWLWFYTNQLIDFSKSIIAVLTFSSNFLFWSQKGYFDASNELKPLLHTWSLGVEEQYYIVFPALLILAARMGPRSRFVLMAVLALVSILFAQWTAMNKPDFGFYMLPTRFWEFMLGFLCTQLEPMLGRWPTWRRNFLSALGLLMLMASVFFYDEKTPFPGFSALIPTVGAALAILFALPDTWGGRLLGSRPIPTIGLLSYSAYLWHQPVFSFARFRSYGDMAPENLVLLIPGILVLSWLSWRFIETPIRRRALLRRTRDLLWVLGLASLVGLSTAAYGIYDNYMGKRSTPYFLRSLERNSDYVADNYYLIGQSWELQREINGIPFYAVNNVPRDREMVFDSGDLRSKMLVVGNSHSVDFYNVLRFSRKISDHFQVARFGANIIEINDELFLSPNYRAADVVVYCSLMSKADLEVLESVVVKTKRDGKKVYVCKNVFTWMERAIFTKLDRLIVEGVARGDGYDQISDSVNARYAQDFHSRKYVNEDWKESSLNLEVLVDRLVHEHSIQVIDRMAYVCRDSSCEILSKTLGKYFYDMGHHTLLGAKYFASIVDRTEVLDDMLKP